MYDFILMQKLQPYDNIRHKKLGLFLVEAAFIAQVISKIPSI